MLVSVKALQFSGRALVTLARSPPLPIFRKAVPQTQTRLFMNFFKKIQDEKDPGNVDGTSLKILKYPHPLLRKENLPIEDFSDSLRNKAAQMLLVMYAANGIGLAAPQVGINERLMVFNESGDEENKDNEMILCNPIILTQSEEKWTREEGCLSFPLIEGEVERSQKIEIKYQTLEGVHQEVELEGMPARIFLHEYDHLDKVLFIDRLSERDLKLNQKRLDKYIKKYGPGAVP